MNSEFDLEKLKALSLDLWSLLHTLSASGRERICGRRWCRRRGTFHELRTGFASEGKNWKVRSVRISIKSLCGFGFFRDL